MDGYYDHHATIVLDKPVALVGFMGSQVDLVARAVSASSGIPFVSLTRWVEHKAGKTLANVVISQGECSLRDLEGQGIARALSERPHPILSLGHGTLLNPDHRARLKNETRMIYLRAPLSSLFAKIQTIAADNPARYWPYATPGMKSADELQELFDAREPLYREAHDTLDVDGVHPHTTALKIGELLGI